MSIRENNKIKTRRNLLKSARRLFKTKGYNETMMSEIAEYAEVSDATLYNYFPTKNDLLIGIAGEETGELRELVSSEDEALKPADVRIRNLMIAHIRDVLSYVALSRRIVFVCAGPDVEESISAGVNEMLFSLLEKGKEEGVFRKDMDSGDAANIIYSIYYGILFNDPMIEKVSIEKTIEKFSRLLDIILAGICLKEKK